MPMTRQASTALALVLLVLVSGCATYSDRVAPVPLPSNRLDAVDIEGARIVAEPYVDKKAAEQAFGFNIRGAGLLPVRFVVDNQSGRLVQVLPKQTFLIDDSGQAWPLLSAAKANRRVADYVEVGETASGAGKPALLLGAAGAVAGLAVGILTGNDAGKSAARGAAAGAAAGALYGGTKANQKSERTVRDDLSGKSLSNRRIRAGQLAQGYLFFPGKDEAKSARALRLSLRVGKQSHTVNIPLAGSTLQPIRK